MGRSRKRKKNHKDHTERQQRHSSNTSSPPNGSERKRRFADWFPWKRILGGLISLGAIGYALSWGYDYWTIKPKISHPELDPKSPLRMPFTISNEHEFITLHAVRPRCAIDRVKTPEMESRGGEEMWASGAPTGTLEPRESRHFRCIAQVNTTNFESIDVTYIVDYEVRPLGLRLRRSSSARFGVRRTTAGEPYWLEGPALSDCRDKECYDPFNPHPSPKPSSPPWPEDWPRKR
jgi:hypothetical protein